MGTRKGARSASRAGMGVIMRRSKLEKSNICSPESLLDREPPCDPGAEKAVLGALLISKNPKKVLDRILPVLSPRDFYDEANQIAFEHIIQLSDGGKPIDAILLNDSLSSATGNDVRAMDDIGGPEYISKLIAAVATDNDAVYHAELVHKSAEKRRILRIG